MRKKKKLKRKLKLAMRLNYRLQDLVRHCWVHSGYKDCGYNQMDTPQRSLYCDVICRTPEEFDDPNDPNYEPPDDELRRCLEIL